MKRREKDQVADLRAWRRHRRERLEEALTGVHRDALERLLAQLKGLQAARELVAFIADQDWSVVDADTRAIALHQINAAIMALRERQGLAPIDNALPNESSNAFRKIIEFPAPSQEGPARRGPYPGADHE